MEKILVVGAGSVGTFLGTKLYDAGHKVVLYGRRKLERLTERVSIDGQSYLLPPRCYEIPIDDYSIIFFTTKLYDTENVLARSREFHLDPRIIAFIQNGLVGKEFYRGWQYHPGFTTLGIFNGYHLVGDRLSIVESDWGWQVESSPTGREIARLLNGAGIRCTVNADIGRTRARKLIFNAALNALSAIEEKTLGELIADADSREIVDGSIEESWLLLKEDYGLAALPDERAALYRLLSQVGEHYSSMYQDLISGRKTEIEFLNGFILRLGREKGILTPYNERIYFDFLEKIRSRESEEPGDSGRSNRDRGVHPIAREGSSAGKAPLTSGADYR